MNAKYEFEKWWERGMKEKWSESQGKMMQYKDVIKIGFLSGWDEAIKNAKNEVMDAEDNIRSLYSFKNTE